MAKTEKTATAKPETKVEKPNALQKFLELKKKTEDQINQKGKGSGKKYIPFFKAEIGDVIKIRILPISFLELPFITVGEHGNLFPDKKWKTIPCPASLNEGDCPICEYAFGMWRDAQEMKKNESEKEKAKAIETTAKIYMPKQKVHSIIWNRVTERVEHWSYSPLILGQILTEIKNAAVDPISDLNEGRDGKIKCVLGNNNNKNYSFDLSEITSPLFDDETKNDEVLAYIESQKQNILDIRTPLSYDAMKALLNFDKSDDDAVDDTDAEDDDRMSEDEVRAEVESLLGK